MFGASALTNAVRHSPSRFIASFPLSNAFEAVHSSPAFACHLTRLPYPNQSTRLFCHRSRAAQLGSPARLDLPFFIHVAPVIGPNWTGEFWYQFMWGLNPSTLIEPSGFFTVSRFA